MASFWWIRAQRIPEPEGFSSEHQAGPAIHFGPAAADADVDIGIAVSAKQPC
jgi:hypothetical protein